MKRYITKRKKLAYSESFKRRLFNRLPFSWKNTIAAHLGLYPRVVRQELSAVKEVLGGTSWNMSYSLNSKHTELEAEFSKYIGSEYAIAVGSGGVAIQLLTRALGLESKSEVIIQVDNCSAVPQALLNAQVTPVMVDVDTESFQFSQRSLSNAITAKTKMILATHMWGNPEDLDAVDVIAKKNDIYLVEDACLALGGKTKGKHLGSFGIAGVFSFGSTKPLQAGEGGMVVTNNRDLAKEIKTLRSWGDREIEYGERDVNTLSWNGRMPEVTAAIALEQLRGYPSRLLKIQERVADFRKLILGIADISVVPGANEVELAFTQLSLRINANSRFKKNELMHLLSVQGVQCFHANFEPITELTLFKSGAWLKWVRDGEQRRNPIETDFPGAYEIFMNSGIGLVRSNFSSARNYNNLVRAIKNIFSYCS